MKKKWVLYPVHDALRDQISRKFELSRVVAQILINRGLDSIDKVDKFLNITLNDLRDPFLLDGLNSAVDRIMQAIKNKETVLIHGDYDVDGVTSTVLLSYILREVDVSVKFFIPNRLIDGYGVGEEGIQSALKVGATLMITVDCGINAVDEVKRLKELGVDVIVTDHHMPGDELPDAVAIVNPNLPDSKYPFKDLAGVGVSFKLAHAILKRARECEMHNFDHVDLKEHLDLVALGTVADMVPLIDENRIFVMYGLKRLSKTSKIGLQKLKETSGISKDTVMKTSHISFLMAPRINSIGRLKDAAFGVELMTCSDKDEAQRLVSAMEDSNRQRQKMEEEIFKKAKVFIESNYDIQKDRILVIAQEGWGVGIVSIVASRLTREYSKPAIVFALENGFGRGSARSINGFNILECINKCQSLLSEFGGHSQAAGLSIKTENIDSFRKKINAIANEQMGDEDFDPEVFIDYKLKLSEIGNELYSEIESMAPFGQKNKTPVFLSQGLIVQETPRCFGRNHIKFVVGDEAGFIIEAIGFNMQNKLKRLAKGDKIDMTYSLNVNEYAGMSTIQIQTVDVRFYK